MTRKNDFPGLSRYGAFSFSIGNYGYIGGGVHYVTNEPSPQCLFDVFRYDPDDDKWTLIGLFPGDYNKMYCYSFVIGTKAYLIGGMDYCNPTLHNDVWEFTDEFDLRKSR
jgi:N-acetylneuraminic acid mutarotase